jgi:hypothetical protein
MGTVAILGCSRVNRYHRQADPRRLREFGRGPWGEPEPLTEPLSCSRSQATAPTSSPVSCMLESPPRYIRFLRWACDFSIFTGWDKNPHSRYAGVIENR